MEDTDLSTNSFGEDEAGELCVMDLNDRMMKLVADP